MLFSIFILLAFYWLFYYQRCLHKVSNRWKSLQTKYRGLKLNRPPNYSPDNHFLFIIWMLWTKFSNSWLWFGRIVRLSFRSRIYNYIICLASKISKNLIFQAPDDIDGLIKNEEVDPSTVPTDSKGKKKKKYLGKILYRVFLNVLMFIK